MLLCKAVQADRSGDHLARSSKVVPFASRPGSKAIGWSEMRFVAAAPARHPSKQEYARHQLTTLPCMVTLDALQRHYRVNVFNG